MAPRDRVLNLRGIFPSKKSQSTSLADWDGETVPRDEI